jgi:hypothetical protein
MGAAGARSCNLCVTRLRNLDDEFRRGTSWGVAEYKPTGRHRVFLPQALGADEYLRVTWHESDRVIVFSHWQGETCVAATPVLVTDAVDLTGLLVDALGEAASSRILPVAARGESLLEKLRRVLGRGRSGASTVRETARTWRRSA